jgi:mono/diheme cytochrome c family protein
MKFRILLLVLLALFVAACSETSSDSETATDAATEETALDDIPSLSGLAFPTATPIPIPVSIDDERFPIQPDPAGQALYEANCAECHGINGGGQNPADPYALNEDGLMVAPPHTNAGHTWHHPDQQNFAAVWAGRQVPGSLPMPGFGESLTVDEVMQILAYIKTWWGGEELRAQTEQTIAAAGR